MSKSQSKAINPVFIVTLGLVFVAIAFILFAFQPGTQFADTSAWGQIVVAFVTGITTGGLSCLAVQGGLLASSLAHQIEQDYTEQVVVSGKKQKRSRYRQFI